MPSTSEMLGHASLTTLPAWSGVVWKSRATCNPRPRQVRTSYNNLSTCHTAVASKVRHIVGQLRPIWSPYHSTVRPSSLPPPHHTASLQSDPTTPHTSFHLYIDDILGRSRSAGITSSLSIDLIGAQLSDPRSVEWSVCFRLSSRRASPYKLRWQRHDI